MIERFFRKIFIAIVQDGGMYHVKVNAYKQKKSLYTQSKVFEGETSERDMRLYLNKYFEESPLHYVALLNPKPQQGAVSGCADHKIDEVEELNGTKTLCRNNKWLLYASLRELDALQSEYKKIGLDFIFSPFSVLEHFFADKIQGGFAMYALAQKDSFSVAIFENGRLDYAHHYPLHARDVSKTEEDESSVGDFSVGISEIAESEKNISLDDIESLDDLDILDELDDLSDIEDLDAIEEIAEFSEDEPTIEEMRQSAFHPEEAKNQMDRFNNDYHRFELIQRTLTHFYGTEQCQNRFVETVYIADAYGSGSDLKRYLEEELFLNVLIRNIDLSDEVIALAMIEEGGR